MLLVGLIVYTVIGVDVKELVPKKEVPSNKRDLLPVDLTSRNFAHHINDGNIWLLEFYSPNCVHCVEFKSTYEEIAAMYHAPENKEKKIRVGRINASEERALATRFSIEAYPYFFVVDGFQVYSYEAQKRNKQTMVRFVEGAYKKIDPIPFFMSPMGPVGILQGFMISAGNFLVDTFAWSESTLGLSPVVTAGILFGAMFMACFFLIVAIAILATPKVKLD